MAQGLEREANAQSRAKDAEEKGSKFVRCAEGRVMGSRRIFPPQFKLQVLDSYRKDEDCKGNQRATARKYGIHRRQIQKWLQVEASLRTSVEVGCEPPPPPPPQQPPPPPPPPPQQRASPSALNLTSAGDAPRQRDDSRGGSGGGESLPAVAVAPATMQLQRLQRDGEGEDDHAKPEHPSGVIKLKEEREDKEEAEEEEETEEDDDEEEEYSEEDNMDSGHSFYNPDEALDFSCAALGKRRSFSLQFKLEVLNAFHADGVCHGNQRATARKFGINRRQVQKWLGQESELRGEAAFRGGLYRQRLGRWLDAATAAAAAAVAAVPAPAAAASDDRLSAALSAAALFDQYGANDYCWDLSNRKRKLEEPETNERAFKKRAPARTVLKEEEEVVVEDAGVAGKDLDVTSTSGRDPRHPAYIGQEEQETALCLVKMKGETEVTSTIDTPSFVHEPFFATSPFHLSPLVLPPAYDFYSFHCRHPCLQQLQNPKWFQSRAAAVPGYF